MLDLKPVLCQYCKKEPVSISGGRFKKQLTFCSDYCKSKFDLKYGLIWLIIATISFGGLELSIKDDNIHPIFTWSFIIFLTLDLYSILKNYLIIRSYGIHETTN